MDETSTQGEQNQEPSVLDYLSFRASPPTSMTNRQRTQGVLWKRRDLFKNHWRPRWFVLHSEQHLLTYYLLANKERKRNRRSSSQTQQDEQSQTSRHTTTSTTRAAVGNRSRTASENSNISQNTVDYDVVPRGSIYLLGSSVEANNLLSKPSENLYVFTITDHEQATFVHLAARSVEVRDEWIQQIMLACNANTAGSVGEASILHHSNDSLNNGLNFNTPVRRQQPMTPITTSPVPFITPNRINTTPPRSRRSAPVNEITSIQMDFDQTLERLVLNQLPPSLTPVGMWMSEAHAIPPSTFEKMEQVLKVLDWDGSSSWKDRLIDAKERVDVYLSDSEMDSLEDLLKQTKAKTPIQSPPATQVSTGIPNTHWSTVPTDSMFDNTPNSLTESMDQLLQRYLPYVDDVNHPDLQFKYDTKGVHCSVHKKELLIRSIRKVEGHTPSDYLQILWVFKKDLEMESNVTKQEPLHQYNPHTSIVYKSYQAVWPTGPREFCSAAHWRLLKHTDTGNMALCLLAFSCREAEAMRPRVAPRHVRGHLNVSLHVWEQKSSGCTHTRILSYDLKGQIPKAIMQTVMTQQADLPRIMDAYLYKVKNRRGSKITPVPEMTYEALYKVLKDQNKNGKKPKLSKSNSNRSVSSTKSDGDDRSEVLSQANSDSGSIFETSPTAEAEFRSRNTPPDILLEGIVLLAPVMLHCLLNSNGAVSGVLLRLIPFNPQFTCLVLTLAAMVFAIRWVMVEHLLHSSIQLSSEQEVLSLPGKNGKTQCHFTINLRNMERYLKEKNGARDKGARERELSHMVIRALALAMEHNPQSVARRILPTFPLVYNPSVVLHGESASFPSDQPIWIAPEQQQSVEHITDYLSDPKAEVEPNFLEAHLLGPSCRLWVSPEHKQHNHPLVQVDWHAPDTPLSIVVSSYVKRQTHSHVTNYLDVSMTFRSHSVEACRSFAKQFQQLIQTPDMCDE